MVTKMLRALSFPGSLNCIERESGETQNVRTGHSHKARAVTMAQRHNWTLCCNAPQRADGHMVQDGLRGEESDWTGCACSGRSRKQR